MEIIGLALIALFVVYKTGLMDLTVNTVEVSTSMVARELDKADTNSKIAKAKANIKAKRKLEKLQGEDGKSIVPTDKDIDALLKGIR